MCTCDLRQLCIDFELTTEIYPDFWTFWSLYLTSDKQAQIQMAISKGTEWNAYRKLLFYVYDLCTLTTHELGLKTLACHPTSTGSFKDLPEFWEFWKQYFASGANERRTLRIDKGLMFRTYLKNLCQLFSALTKVLSGAEST
jgi:hypothetical protein